VEDRVRKVGLTGSPLRRVQAWKWITRSNVKVDRVACPWLIRRFVDPQAEFLFVSKTSFLTRARKEGATPFDATRFPEVKLNHRENAVRLKAILEDYKLTDSALHRLALIVRGADVKGQEHVSPESLGLRAIAQGFALTGISDEERLAREFPMYDALYEYVRQQLKSCRNTDSQFFKTQHEEVGHMHRFMQRRKVILFASICFMLSGITVLLRTYRVIIRRSQIAGP